MRSEAEPRDSGFPFSWTLRNGEIPYGVVEAESPRLAPWGARAGQTPENPQALPSLRLVIYYASKNKKSGLALTSLQIDDAIPSYACTLQLPLLGLVGKGAGVWRTGPQPISVLESMAAWMAVRLCTMRAETGTLDRRPGHTCSAVPDDVTARRAKETKRAALFAWFDQRRRSPWPSIWGRCQRVLCLPAVARGSRTRCRLGSCFSRVEPGCNDRTLLARWDQTNLMPTCQLMFKRPLTHGLLHFYTSDTRTSARRRNAVPEP